MKLPSVEVFWWDRGLSWYVLPTITFTPGGPCHYRLVSFLWLRFYVHIYLSLPR